MVIIDMHSYESMHIHTYGRRASAHIIVQAQMMAKPVL